MSRIRPLQWQYSAQLNTKIADFLPIIGNKIPNKLLTYFDNTDYSTGLVYFGTESAPQMIGLQNQNKSYRADGCFDLNFNGATNQHKSVWIDFTKIAGYYNTAETQENFVDLKSLSRKTNNFATIYRSGSGTGNKDDLFFVLNIYNQIFSGSAQMLLTFYNGTQTATLNGNYNPVFQKSNALNMWQKCQWALNSTSFVYAAGFTDTSWSNITQVQITFYAPLKTPTNGDIFLHGAWLALPQTNSYLTGAATNPTITGDYYPDLSTNAAYMAHNASTTISQTLGAGIAATIAGGKGNLVILDSYNYHPTSADMKTYGITQGNINIYAGYLEEPSISSKKTVINPNIVGAKTIGHTYYNDAWKTTIGGQRFTVGKSGAQYSTIQSAINATTNTLAYIDFIDSAVYSEILTVASGKKLVIQAVDGQSPTIQNTATGSNVGITINGMVIFSNINFNGAGEDSELFIGASGGISTFNNCTFKNVGSNNFYNGNGRCFKTLTASSVSFYDCLFSNMGYYINVIDMSAATSSSLTMDNCIAMLPGNNTLGTIGLSTSQTATNFIFFNAGASQTFLLTGNQILQDNANGYAYMVANGGVSASAPQTMGIFFNETNCRQSYGLLKSVPGNDSIWICKNNMHDMGGSLSWQLTANGQNFVALFLAAMSGVCHVTGNIFNNVAPGVNRAMCISSGILSQSGLMYTNNNIFYNCNIAIDTVNVGANTWDNNVAVNCLEAFSISHNNSSVTINGWIFSNCKNSVVDVGTVFGSFNNPFVYINNSIVFNSPLANPVLNGQNNTNGTQEFNVNVSLSDPGFINPFGLDFSWSHQSEIELMGITAWIDNNGVVNSKDGYASSFYFINLEGDTGECFYNPQIFNGMNFYYTTLTGFGVAFVDNTITVANANQGTSFNFCHFTSNGIGARINRPTGTLSNFTSCIFDDNDTAILARSGVILNHVTATNNTYGVTAPEIGLLSVKGAISGLFNILGCIFFKNSGFDYFLNFVPTGCIIGTSFYNIGLTTAFTSTLLDPDYYFPAIKKLGYAENSPAFNNVSGNIGARGSNAYLTPTLTSNTYASAYVGTIGTSDTTDLFYALENPQTFPVSQTAINPSGITFVTGDYASSPTAYAGDVVLKWGAPGEDAKISSAMQSAIIGMYQSGWFIAISNDMGATWTYYRVIKDAAISMEQKKYLFDDTGTNPYGNFSLHLRLIPNFNILDYTV